MRAATLFVLLLVTFAQAETASLKGSQDAIAARFPQTAVVVHTTGGKGFHRHLKVHIPLIPSTISASSARHVVDITIDLRLRNTFFLDVAEVEQLWTYHHFAPIKGSAGFAVESVSIVSPVQTSYPYDIEAPVMKVPYTFNDAQITFRVSFLHLRESDQGEELVLSLPIHERYERVSADGSESHVQRCIIIEGGGAVTGERFGGTIKASVDLLTGPMSYIGSLPVKFVSIEEDAEWASTDAHPSWSIGTSKQIADAFCFQVPLGDLTDLPVFYGLTMSLMVGGAISVFLALRNL